jgi:excinuclease ABC subunit C
MGTVWAICRTVSKAPVLQSRTKGALTGDPLRGACFAELSSRHRHAAAVSAILPDLTEQLAGLPDTSGVYLHKDARGRVLYVGKAKSLRNRVRSYFQPSAAHPVHIAAMVRQVANVEVFQTRNEAEALLLESNLIKKHKPRYNINLKDDKSYPFFKLTVNEMYPRLYLVREKLEKDAEYYGPYPSVKNARETLNLIHRYFKLRTSKMALDGTKTYRPCINFQLNKCLAPCRGVVAVEEYRQIVNQVRLFFQGRHRELIARLEAEMREQAVAQRYEEAARLRDAVRAIGRTMEKQRALIPDESAEQDVFGLYRESHYAAVQVLFIRSGRLIGSDCLFLEGTEGSEDAEIVKGVLSRLYTRPSALPPREILIPVAYEDQQVLEDYLSENRLSANRLSEGRLAEGRGSRVHILVPQKGEKRYLIELARENARHALQERMAKRVSDEAVLAEVQRRLHLRREPGRVEAFDISNIAGTHTVASMVVWEHNKPLKEGYRKFQIRTVPGSDDFASMEEVLTRRYRKTVEDGEPLPDLILIDGGKGQVNMAASVLRALGISLTQVDLIGLAKGRSERRRERAQRGRSERAEDFEYVVKPELKHELRLARNSATLHFLQRIRDESHRFAVAYHRSLRAKSSLRSALEELPGVGAKRTRDLLRRFGSLKAVREAELEQLETVPGLPLTVARTIYRAFHPEPGEAPGRALAG